MSLPPLAQGRAGRTPGWEGPSLSPGALSALLDGEPLCGPGPCPPRGGHVPEALGNHYPSARLLWALQIRPVQPPRRSRPFSSPPTDSPIPRSSCLATPRALNPLSWEKRDLWSTGQTLSEPCLRTGVPRVWAGCLLGKEQATQHSEPWLSDSEKPGWRARLAHGHGQDSD